MKIAVILGVTMLVLLWRHYALSVDYEHEQVAHLQTQTALSAALAEGQRWRTVAAEYQTAANAQQQLAEACLAREAQSQSDANARKAILTPAKPRPRTVAERDKVVDDETRIRVADRLNRPL